MDDLQVPQRRVIDLTDAALAREVHLCGLCGCADELFRLVTSPSAFCEGCFQHVYV